MSKKSNNNIVIVGMMGVGKSSVGKVLAINGAKAPGYAGT